MQFGLVERIANFEIGLTIDSWQNNFIIMENHLVNASMEVAGNCFGSSLNTVSIECWNESMIQYYHQIHQDCYHLFHFAFFNLFTSISAKV